jgi:hypothetical protein
MSQGLDSDSDLTNYGGDLTSAGYSWVGRYINPGKSEPLTGSEAQALSKAGLYIVSIWEQGSPTESDYFTTQAGTDAGNGAVTAAQSIGQPAGTSIFFSVDYDATEDDLTDIGSYFAALHPIVRADGYYVGVYGSGTVCQYLWEQGYVGYISNNKTIPLTWLAMSVDYTGYTDWFPMASIVQILGASDDGSFTVDDLDVDLDISNGDVGGWQITAT